MPAAGVDVAARPFPGIRSFEPGESHLFHGRKEHTQQLLRALTANRFLAVVGTSGSGKSSLVKAGLIPALHRGYLRGASSRWRVALMRPGTAPVTALARALALPQPVEEVRKALDRTTVGLTEVIREATLDARENVLVVVDQFEELFRFLHGREAAHFVALLLRAAEEVELPIYVVITMRADFLGHCAHFAGLPEALNSAQFLIPRLTRAQREEAILAPLDTVGVTIKPELVQRLLDDAGDDPDQLPALAHALSRLYSPEGINDYPAEHRVGTSLDTHAESIYRSFDAAGQKLTERIFRALTTIEDGKAIRRPTPIVDLCAIVGRSREAVEAVTARFGSPQDSLLQVSADGTIDITHETLLRQWKRLSDWVHKEAESVGWLQRAQDSASRKGSLWQDPDATHAWTRCREDGWNPAWAKQYGASFGEVREFLRRSRNAAARKRAWLVGYAAVLTVAIVLVGWFTNSFYVERNRSDNLRRAAEESANLARIASAEAQHATTRAEIAEAKAQELAAEVQAQNSTGSERERHEKDAEAAKSRAAQLENKAKDQQQQFQFVSSSAELRIRDLEGQIKELKGSEEQLQGQIGRLQQQNRDLQARISGSQAAPPDASSLISDLQDKIADLEKQLKNRPPTAPPPGPARAERASPITHSLDGLVYVRLPPGTIKIGCSDNDPECDGDEKPIRDVRLTRGFWLGQSEVTQGAYEKVMGRTNTRRSAFDPDHPMDHVGWGDARDYCNAIDGRLPTEAEWEYAARAGSRAVTYGRPDTVAWHAGNSEDKSHPVKTRSANTSGLFDMLGNVREWVGDYYKKDYLAKAPALLVNPLGPAEGSTRVVRGGSFKTAVKNLRVSRREDEWWATELEDDLGFRCAGDW